MDFGEFDEGVEVAPETIMTACKEQLGSVKAPKSVDFVAALPKSANGKVLKKAVRERYWSAAGRRI